MYANDKFLVGYPAIIMCARDSPSILSAKDISGRLSSMILCSIDIFPMDKPVSCVLEVYDRLPSILNAR